MAWAIVLLDLPGLVGPGDAALSRLAVGVAVVASIRLMMWGHQKSHLEAFELGMELGRREAIRDMNQRGATVTPIRRAPGGLHEFNATHRKRLNGNRVDA